MNLNFIIIKILKNNNNYLYGERGKYIYIYFKILMKF